MKKALQILFVVLLTFFIGYSLGNAQNPGYTSNLFTIKSGLSNTYINTVFCDSYGYLWLGTPDGLNRYDGSEFQVFKNQTNDSNSICNNEIHRICEDNNGDLWVATGNGLSKYNRRAGNFTNYYHNPSNSNSISDNTIYYVYQDMEGNIWAKTQASLDKIDIRKNIASHYKINSSSENVNDDSFFSIVEDSNKRFWIGTNNGLYCYDKNIKLIERFENIPKNEKTISNNRIKDICKDNIGNIWIGTENGLNYLNTNTKEFKRFFQQTGLSNSLLGNSINNLYLDKSGVLWISTKNGLCNFHHNSFNQYKSINYSNGKIVLSAISSITLDKANILWLGTYKGLVKIDLKAPKFNIIRNSEGANYDFALNNTTAVFTDKNSSLWFGILENGLTILQSNGISKTYTKQSHPELFKSNNINVIVSDNNANVWLGTDNGIVIYNKKTQQFDPLQKFKKDCSFLENNIVYTIHQDKHEQIWIGTERGLYVLKIIGSKVGEYLNLPDSQKLKVGKVYSISEDANGSIWLGTNQGLVKFEPERKVVKYYYVNKHDPNSIASNSINVIYCCSNGNVWVGTNAGLCKYNRAKDNFTTYTENEGLPNNFINAILDDKLGNIWVSTNKGLAQLNTSKETVTCYDLADGLQGYEFNKGVACKDPSGDFYFGGINGINNFFPDSLKTYSTQPNVEITSIKLFRKGSTKNLTVWPDEVIKIPANTNRFVVSFAVLDFTFPENNRYHYMLTPLETEGQWVDNGSQPSATFSNLPPGKYLFRVKGANSDMIWSTNQYSITLVIESPIWKTSTAIVLYLILLILGIYGAVQWRTRKLRQTNKMLKDKETAALKIAQQKEELILKNKNITDSINYAKRIQVAVMPSEKTFMRILPNSFVFHKPRDIVSGDFYWIYERNNKIFIAAVDCTGHGVPGAFMSILGVELFRKITQSYTEDPGQILSKLNEDFSRIFSDIDDVSLKDGMDISFCVIDKTTFTLEYAGAFNPLYILRENKIIEIKGNRFSVSMEMKQESLMFTTHTVPLQKDDMIYIFSDGYADQFGGYENKKFKYRRFRHLLLNIHRLPLNDQKAYLDESMELWRGNNEQVDDILIIGVLCNFGNL